MTTRTGKPLRLIQPSEYRGNGEPFPATPQPEKPRLWVVPRDVPRLAVVHPERPGAA